MALTVTVLGCGTSMGVDHVVQDVHARGDQAEGEEGGGGGDASLGSQEDAGSGGGSHHQQVLQPLAGTQQPYPGPHGGLGGDDEVRGFRHAGS